MTKPGPRPTPTKVLELRGSWRAKTRPQEPVPQAALPPCPKWLDAESKKLWRKLTADLHAMGIVGKVDSFALARYCALSTQFTRLQAFIQEHGLTYESKRTYRTGQHTDDEGTVIPHHTVEVTETTLYPQVRLMVALSDKLLHMEQQFGMTPSARAALGVELARTMPKPTHPLTGNPRRFLHLGDPG